MHRQNSYLVGVCLLGQYIVLRLVASFKITRAKHRDSQRFLKYNFSRWQHFLVFIRTPDKIRSEAGMPIIEGYHGDDQSDERLKSEAEKIG